MKSALFIARLKRHAIEQARLTRQVTRHVVTPEHDATLETLPRAPWMLKDDERTHWRVKELKHHSADLVWLDAEDARRAYDLVALHDSKTHLGLNADTVDSIERFAFGNDAAIATSWLRARVPAIQQVAVVFGEDECFVCSSVFLIENWSDIFVPSRDDAMIYSNDTPLIVLYCHESAFEVGQRIVFD